MEEEFKKKIEKGGNAAWQRLQTQIWVLVCDSVLDVGVDTGFSVDLMVGRSRW